MKEKFDVTGMTCSACSSRVEKCVSKLEGIENVSVNLLTNSMQVEYNDTVLSESQIIDAVVKAGYGASPKQEHVQTVAAGKAKVMENPMEKQIQNMKFRLIVSFVFLVPLMYVSMGHMVGLPLPGFLTGIENAVSFAFTQLLLCLPIIYVNRKYYIKGFQTLAHLAPNMDSLIAIGSTASLVYGIFAIYRMSYGLGSGNMEVVHLYYHDLYFESAAMILALITVGKYLETRSKGENQRGDYQADGFGSEDCGSRKRRKRAGDSCGTGGGRGCGDRKAGTECPCGRLYIGRKYQYRRGSDHR